MDGELEGMASGLRIPERIGSYRILRRIGTGGMGTVFEAEQESPRRKVALKIVRSTLVSPESLTRFRHEVQVLGRLQHPGIAQIFDAGSFDSAAGLSPFFAMELVTGESLTDHAARKKLDVPDRIRLVLPVLDALQYAHQKGVIHRDLKPANILVDEQGRPRILDFGIARSMDPVGDDDATLTEAGQLVGTLAYMSPEQTQGGAGDLDVRSDVYSMGVVIYQLLTGELPYAVPSDSLADAILNVRDADPVPPSRHRPGLRGDVDCVLLKTLEKDPNRRYATVSELAADLRRYLENQPVLARPSSTAYHLRKLARRHKAATAAVAAITLVVVVALVVVSRLYVTAERARLAEAQQAERLEAVNTFVLQQLLISGSPMALGPEVKLGDAMDHVAEYAAQHLTGRPLLEAEVLRSLGFFNASSGRFEEGEPQARRAVEIAKRELGTMDPVTLDYELVLVDIWSNMQRLDEAEPHSRELLERSRELLGEEHLQTIHASGILGNVLQKRGRFDEAEPMLRWTIRKEDELDPDPGSSIPSRTVLVGALQAQGRADEAVSLARETVTLARKVSPERSPVNVGAGMSLLGALLSAGEYEEASALIDELRGDVAETFPEEHPYQGGLPFTNARLLGALGQWARALDEAEDAYAIQLRSFGPCRFEVEQVASAGVRIARELEDWDALEKWSYREIGLRARVAGTGEQESMLAKIENVESLPNHERSEAEDLLWRRIPELARATPDGHERRARFYGNFGRAFLSLGRIEQARSLLRSAYAAVEYSDTRDEEFPVIVEALASIAQRRGDAAAAAR